MSMEITVIFPAYNEEENIRETMDRALAALRPRFERFEIIIIDDCGSDATGKIADELAGQHPEIRVLHNPRNLGSAGSVLRGIKHARYGLVTHNSMDYPFDLCDLDKMVPLLAEADIVVATRDQRAGYNWYRKFISGANIGLLHLLFPLRLSDYNFTQLYPKAYLDRVEVVSTSAGFVTPELLIRAADMGMRVKAIEIPYYPRLKGEATSGNPRIVLHSLGDLLRFWWLRLRGGTKTVNAPVRPA
jgi:glycosyltransferase involved in cell wall biosynthesis